MAAARQCDVGGSLAAAWRQHSIIVIGSDGSTCGDVHRVRQCATNPDDDAADNDTADTDGDCDANDIVC